MLNGSQVLNPIKKVINRDKWRSKNLASSHPESPTDKAPNKEHQILYDISFLCLNVSYKFKSKFTMQISILDFFLWIFHSIIKCTYSL